MLSGFGVVAVEPGTASLLILFLPNGLGFFIIGLMFFYELELWLLIRLLFDEFFSIIFGGITNDYFFEKNNENWKIFS